jgi:hypothetical protein
VFHISASPVLVCMLRLFLNAEMFRGSLAPLRSPSQHSIYGLLHSQGQRSGTSHDLPRTNGVTLSSMQSALTNEFWSSVLSRFLLFCSCWCLCRSYKQVTPKSVHSGRCNLEFTFFCLCFLCPCFYAFHFRSRIVETTEFVLLRTIFCFVFYKLINRLNWL